MWLRNSPGKTREGSTRWQRQGHAAMWVSTGWRERLQGGGSPGAAEPELSCAVTARKKEQLQGRDLKPHVCPWCQQIHGAGVGPGVCLHVVRASAHTESPQIPCHTCLQPAQVPVMGTITVTQPVSTHTSSASLYM